MTCIAKGSIDSPGGHADNFRRPTAVHRISSHTILRGAVRRLALLPILVLVIWATGCGERKTNTSDMYGQVLDISVAPNGRYVIVWSDMNGATTGTCTTFQCRLYARVYDQSGNPVTGQILVSPTTNGKYTYAAAAINDSGDFAIVYDSYAYVASASHLSYRLFYRRYSANGTPTGPAQQLDYGLEPDAVMAANGDLYVTYHTHSNFNITPNIFVQKLNPAGFQLMPRVFVDSGENPSSTIRAICTGEFLVSYAIGPEVKSLSTYVKRYYASGSAKGPRILVNQKTQSAVAERLIYKPNGHFAIVSAPFDPIGLTWDNYIMRYDGGGNLTGPPEFLFNSAANDTIATMSANECGQYALAYTVYHLGDVMVKEYNYDDVPFAPYKISQATPNRLPHIQLSSAFYVAAWNRQPLVNPPYENDIIHIRGLSASAFGQGSLATVCYAGCSACPKSAVIGRPAVPGYTYSWSPTNYLSNPNVAQPTVTHPGGASSFTTTYMRTISAPCCQRTEAVTVTFNPGCGVKGGVPAKPNRRE